MTVSTPDPELIARTVLACPAVESLDSGGPGGPATYLPGRRIDGVSVSDSAVSVRVRMSWGTTVAAVDTQIRAVLLPIAGGRRVDITVGDIATPQDAAGSGDTDGPPGISPASA